MLYAGQQLAYRGVPRKVNRHERKIDELSASVAPVVGCPPMRQDTERELLLTSMAPHEHGERRQTGDFF